MKKHIVIIEDEESIRELLKCTLEAFSYETTTFESGQDFFLMSTQKGQAFDMDLILLDVMLPNESGLDIIKKLKSNNKTKNVPVIFISAKTSEIDKVKGLDLGAEDYIAKPFGTLELAARVRTALRRNENVVKQEDVICRNNIKIDLLKREVTKDDGVLALSLKEFELLKILLTNDNKVVEREVLLNEVWGYDFVGETRTLDMHIKSLRNKLGDDAENPTYIKTVRGIGYLFI